MKVTIYMKSGNKINVNFVKDLKINYQSNLITRLQIERSKLGMFLGFKRLMVESVDLSQIEAITYRKFG